MRTPLITSLALLTATGLIGTGFILAQRTPNVVAADNVDTEVAATADTTTAPPTMPPCGGERRTERLQKQADLFKMSLEDLQKELATGKPMYQIAAEHGVTYDTIKTQRQSELKTRIDDMVAKGFMTQAQADAEIQQSDSLPIVGIGGHNGFGHRGWMMK